MASETIYRPLNAAVSPLGSLGLYTGGTRGPLVGRPRELETIRRAMGAARDHMACVAIEGEPGIGKTRLLLAVEEQARSEGFVPVAVTADEEIRGPFLVARSIFGSPALLAASDDSEVVEALTRAGEALSGRGEAGLESMAPDQRLVRTFDLASIALHMLAARRPLALLLDDVQWADEDSLRLLRYLVRTGASSPILLVLATRPDETAFVHEAVTLLADLDRLGILNRMRLSRFSQLESTELLQQVLGGQVNLQTAAVMHAQAEGVPFVLVEQASAYREAGLIQQIDGVWTLARNAQRLLPSAVRTLIDRRAARLPEETRNLMGEAAVLGRNFSLRDLTDVRRHLGDVDLTADAMEEIFAPAVSVGLLIQHSDAAAAADYTFSHEGVREHSAAGLPAPRRRAIHSAIATMLQNGQGDRPECLVMVAQHALAAGQAELSVRVSIEAARSALQTNAPDEALRLVEQAQRVAAGAQDRIALLMLQDEALAMLRRPWQRQEGLTELAALAEALGDPELELDIMLRRASVLRLSEDHEAAALLAGQVRARARELEATALELAASLELAQNMLRSELGDGYNHAASDADLDGAQPILTEAVDLAREIGDERSLAAALRELGVIEASHVRIWFIDAIRAGDHIEILARVAQGEPFSEILATLPIAPNARQAVVYFREALELYERLGDRRGTMSTIIAMAIVTWAAEIHFSGSTRHLEEIRRLATRLKSMSRESERARADAQMLFGSHVYARIRGIADAAIEKGREAYNSARAIGDPGLEFASAFGVAIEYATVGMPEESERWIERASAIASAAPTPLRARQLETARGMAQWAAGDASQALLHLERTVALATEQGQAAARCEALAQLATCAAWLGVQADDDDVIALAERAAHDVHAARTILPGHPPWCPQADAALAHIARHRGDDASAVEHARAALTAIDEAVREEFYFDVELMAGLALLNCGSETERAEARERGRLIFALILQRISDEEIRAHWFRARWGRALGELAGPITAPPVAGNGAQPAASLDEGDLEIIRLVAAGYTNSEIARALDVDEVAVSQQLTGVFARLGVASRADATTAALVGRLV